MRRRLVGDLGERGEHPLRPQSGWTVAHDQPLEPAVGCDRRCGDRRRGREDEGLRRRQRRGDRCECRIANHEPPDEQLREPAHRRVVDRIDERRPRVGDLAGRAFDRGRAGHVLGGNLRAQTFGLDRRAVDGDVGLGEQLDRFPCRRALHARRAAREGRV